MSSLRRVQRFAVTWAACCAVVLTGGAGAGRAQTATPTYFEFGTVVAINRQSVEIQTFDPQRQRLVQHSFMLSKETRADVVHVGDSVEVVFTPVNGDYSLRRMIALTTGIPIAGPPPAAYAGSGSRGAGTQVQAPAAVVPQARAAQLPAAPATQAPPPAAQISATVLPGASLPATAPSQVAAVTPAAAVPPVATAKAAKTPRKNGKSKALPTPLPAKAAPVPSATSLVGSTARTPSRPGVVSVDLGAAPEALVKPRSVKDASIARPAEECNRSSTDWPVQPLRMAVLDFRYPTEREEAHDIGTTGGGSGTAVADLVFARLEQVEQQNDLYAFSRGDRRRLDRSDFAGAARLGRQLGVDAVLAGTFVPVAAPAGAQDDPLAVKSWELRAGIVDTCTGQLLVQTSSLVCPNGLEPGLTVGADPASCRHLATSAVETSDPKAHAAAYRPLLDDLLFALEHTATPAQQAAATGTVIAVRAEDVTVQLAGSARVKPGDVLAVHASRVAKNPSTYTLKNLQNEEIGRVTVRSVQGSQAHGAYTGDYATHPGDTTEPFVPQQ